MEDEVTVQVYESEFATHLVEAKFDYKVYSFAEYLRDLYYYDRVLQKIWDDAEGGPIEAPYKTFCSECPPYKQYKIGKFEIKNGKIDP